MVADQTVKLSSKFPKMPGDLVSGLWRDNRLERHMALNGDVKDLVSVHEAQKQKNNTNCKQVPTLSNAVEGQQGYDCDHWGAHNGLVRPPSDQVREAEVRWRGFSELY